MEEIEKLKELLNETTIVCIKDNKFNLIVGDENLFDFDPNEPGQELRLKEPYDLLTSDWEKIWDKFDKKWNPQRQLFRFFWTETKSFFLAYRLFRERLGEFSSLALSDRKTKGKMILNADICELLIGSIYEHGIRALNIFEKIIKNLPNNPFIGENYNVEFCKLFKGTRNKFLSHYHNAIGFYEFYFDPIFFSTMGTGGRFEVRIHRKEEESKYYAYIMYRRDYFDLEKIFIYLIKKISETDKLI